MADRVVLHIGTMKSGTSYLQSVLGGNRKLLEGRGCRYLGGGFGAQARAVREILRRPEDVEHCARWRALAEEARTAAAHTAMVSMEFLSYARDPALDALLAPLDGLEVDVVLTVRDQFQTLPAQWQTFARNTGNSQWPTYLTEIGAHRGHGARKSHAYRTFHRAQDVVRILQRWSGHPAVNRVAVVTVPRDGADRDELWHRFAAATGVPDDVELSEKLRSNPSLGYASCDFLCRMNAHLDGVPQQPYIRVVRPLSREALRPLRSDEGRPGLDARAARYVRERNRRIRTALEEGLREGSCELIGSPDDLSLPDSLAGYPRTPADPPRAQVQRAAEAAWDHLARTSGTEPGPRPDGLDELAAGAARLLRASLGRSTL